MSDKNNKILEGKTAIVTGSAKRLGKATLLELAKNGANVVVHYNKSEKEAQDTVNEAKQLGVNAIKVCADLTDPKAVERMFKEVIKNFKEIHILINNASTLNVKPIDKLSLEEWNYQINSTLNTTYYCCRASLPYLRKTQGKIINIGSGRIEEISSKPKTTAYQIAKTGILILSRTLAVSEAGNNITVNLVSPGILSITQNKPKINIIPSGRYGEYNDITNAIIFLLKAESNHITGTNLKVSGGYGI